MSGHCLALTSMFFTVALCRMPTLQCSQSHRVLGHPGLEWGLQEWCPAILLFFLSLSKGLVECGAQWAPSPSGERALRTGELEGSGRSLRGRLWHPVEPSHHLEGRPGRENRIRQHCPGGRKDTEDWNSEPSRPEGTQPDAGTCALLRPMEEDVELSGGGRWRHGPRLREHS